MRDIEVEDSESQVVCRKGKCEYKDHELNTDWKQECVDCNLEEQIEHDVIKGKKSLKKPTRGKDF